MLSLDTKERIKEYMEVIVYSEYSPSTGQADTAALILKKGVGDIASSL